MGKHQKVTNERIDAFIKNKNIVRLEDVKSDSIPIKVVCLVDGYIWNPSPRKLLNNRGCPKCGGTTKHTIKHIDSELVKRNIKRIGEYINSHNPIQLKCRKPNCQYEWKANMGNVIGKKLSGCPKCSKRCELNNEEIDKRLQNRTIKRNSDFISSKLKLEWKCLEIGCNRIWPATVGNVIYGKSGCPKCSCGKSERRIEELINIYIKYDLMKRNFFRYIPNLIYPDFYLEINKNKIIIEYNGEQHYKPVRFFGAITHEEAERDFDNQKIRDQNLRDYCNKNEIFLLEIPYTWQESRTIKELEKINLLFHTSLPKIDIPELINN